MTRTIHFRGCFVELALASFRVTFPDCLQLDATPDLSTRAERAARDAGYTDGDVWQAGAEAICGHAALAEADGLQRSPQLHNAAARKPLDACVAERARVEDILRMLNGRPRKYTYEIPFAAVAKMHYVRRVIDIFRGKD